MKIIFFLDVDGVMTTMTWMVFTEFNPSSVQQLKMLLDMTGAKLVISSTWRADGINNGSHLDRELEKWGLKKYLHDDWSTGYQDGIRGNQIKAWLDSHPDIDNYVIFDDDQDMLEEQMSHLVLTDSLNGLLHEHMQKAFKILNIPDNKIVSAYHNLTSNFHLEYDRMNNNTEYIICSAIWYNDGIKRLHQPKNIQEGIVYGGRRHHNCFIMLNSAFPNYIKKNHIQGFLTNFDRFVDRKEASIIAYKSGQIKYQKEYLTSEDLY